MTGADRSDPPPDDPDGQDLHDLARDWITLWQSELAALAVDREAQETWHVLLSLWAGAAGTMINAMPRGMPHEAPRRGRRSDAPGPNARGSDARGSDARRDGSHADGPHSAGPAAAPGAAPAAAAPDPRDAEVERLRDRVADLERRLAGLERRRRR